MEEEKMEEQEDQEVLRSEDQMLQEEVSLPSKSDNLVPCLQGTQAKSTLLVPEIEKQRKLKARILEHESEEDKGTPESLTSGEMNMN